MGCDIFMKMWVLGGLLLLLNLSLLGVVIAAPQVPCYFIFGDSLVDNGNNNNIPSAARANYRPYGIDFPQGPTGRFSNGRTTVDVLGELLFIFSLFLHLLELWLILSCDLYYT